MDDAQVDEAILSSAGEHWQKVAKIIVISTKALGVELQEGNIEVDRIADRIKILVIQRRLEAQGDLKKWRHSEVRLPS
jgi:hypothetical protein